MIDRFLCADAARDRADPLTGTALSIHRWLLIEHPGPWAFDAFAGAGIDEAVRATLVDAVQTSRTRLLLVRRTGRVDRDAPRRWAIVNQAADVAQLWGTWEVDDDLLGPARILTGAASPLPAAGVDDDLVLVCTHGRHDTCCAVRGRPVAAALAERWPEQTWECSHVGGDRFAPNVIVVPDGTYYGYLDVDSAVATIGSHLAGTVDAEHLRGMTAHPPVVQAAVAAAYQQLGPAGPRDVTSYSLRRLDAGSWQVRLVCRPPLPHEVVTTVTRTVRAPSWLTCRAFGTARAWQYDVAPLSTT